MTKPCQMFIQPHQAQCKAFEKSLNKFPDADQQFHISSKNACFCARVVEIGGKLFIHDLKHTLVVKYDDLEEMAYMKTDLTSPFPRIQGRALQWSSSMGPHLYKVISFMRIPGCLLFIGCVVFLRHTTQSIGVDFSQNALSSWLLPSSSIAKKNLPSDWCDCFYLFLITTVTHNAPLLTWALASTITLSPAMDLASKCISSLKFPKRYWHRKKCSFEKSVILSQITHQRGDSTGPCHARSVAHYSAGIRSQ